MKEKAYKMGEGFKAEVDLSTWEDNGKHKASVNIGEEYYESDPYKDKACALSEVKGWLEGVKVQIEAILKYIEKEIDENNKDTTD